jgi:hypothetical protein
MVSLPLVLVNHLQTFKIQDRTDLCQKIHAKNPIDLEAIVHEAYFNFKILYLQVSQCDPIQTLGKDKFLSTNSPYSVDEIVSFVLATNCRKSIGWGNTPSGSGIKEHILQLDLTTAVCQLRNNE